LGNNIKISINCLKIYSTNGFIAKSQGVIIPLKSSIIKQFDSDSKHKFIAL